MSSGLSQFVASAIGCAFAAAMVVAMDHVRPWARPLVLLAGFALLIIVLLAFAEAAP